MSDETEQARRDLGAAIRELREAIGLSQHRFAPLLETNQARLSRYEAGSSTPSYEVLLRVARELGMPASAILVRAEMIAALRSTRAAATD